MIYLIKSPSFKYRFTLKIGYTMDDSGEKRFEAYRSCNPEIEVLYTIPGGTLEDETNLHKYFRHLRSCRTEWYIDSLDIINFFKTHTTKESLKDVDIFGSFSDRGDTLSKKMKVLRPFVIAVKKVTGRLDESIYNLCVYASENVGLEWICNYYPDLAVSILQEYEDIKDSLSGDKLKRFIKYLQDSSNGHISERLKKLCETSELTDDEKSLVAQQSSEKFDQYYNIVGSKRCAELGYNITYIKNEIKNFYVDRRKLTSLIYDTFKVNSKYSNVNIKETLNDIYDTCGIKQIAKATDLKDYFNVKPVQIYYPDKPKENGLKILSVKE